MANKISSSKLPSIRGFKVLLRKLRQGRGIENTWEGRGFCVQCWLGCPGVVSLSKWHLNEDDRSGPAVSGGVCARHGVMIHPPPSSPARAVCCAHNRGTVSKGEGVPGVEWRMAIGGNGIRRGASLALATEKAYKLKQYILLLDSKFNLSIKGSRASLDNHWFQSWGKKWTCRHTRKHKTMGRVQKIRLEAYVKRLPKFKDRIVWVSAVDWNTSNMLKTMSL